jgi:hypothetical protein
LKISGYFREAPPTLISISNRIFPTLEFAEMNIGIKREVNGKAGIKWGRNSCLPIGPGSDRWHSRRQEYPRHLGDWVVADVNANAREFAALPQMSANEKVV